MTRELKPCGTHSAYVRHRNRGELACEACKDALAEYQRNRGYDRALSELRKRHPTEYAELVAHHRSEHQRQFPNGTSEARREYTHSHARADLRETHRAEYDAILTQLRTHQAETPTGKGR